MSSGIAPGFVREFFSILPAIVILFLCWAACSDLASRVIPNRLSLSLALLFFVYALAGPVYLDIALHLIWGGGSLLALLPLFAFGKMGGGDVKLISATALWCGPITGPEFLVVTAFAGGILALVAITPVVRYLWEWGHRILGLTSTVSLFPTSISLPYGVAIAAGGSFSIVQAFLR